jgi:hypothetical protein
MIIKRLLLLFLIVIRIPWTVFRFFRAYHYAKYIDMQISHNGVVTLALESGESISYVRGSGLTILKFIGAFIDRR